MYNSVTQSQMAIQLYDIYHEYIDWSNIWNPFFIRYLSKTSRFYCNVIMRWYGIIMKGYAFMSTDIICKCAERAQYRFDKMFVNIKWGTLLSNYQV